MTLYRTSAVLIVKNEQEHLPACLAALDGVADEIVVADTGSTDRSVEIAEGFTERVFRVQWTNDFAAARNAAIAHARGAWILSIDADECIEGGAQAGQRLLAFIEAHPPHTVGTVAIHNVDDGTGVIEETLDHTERFFHREHFRFAGAIHEQLVGPSKAGAPTGLHLVHTGYAQASTDPAHKSRRNIPLLLAEIAARPGDEYLYFQLGKAHYALKEYAPAAEAFQAALSRMRFDGNALPTGIQGPIARPVVTACIVNLAYALVNLGRAEEARTLLEEHAQLGHPGTRWADFHHVTGYVFLMLGDVPRSRAAYEASLALGAAREDVVGTGSFASLYHLGLLAEAEQKQSAAAEHYGASLAHRRDYRPTISRAIDWLSEGGAPTARLLLQLADPAAAAATCLDRLALSLQNGGPGAAQRLAEAMQTVPGPLREHVAAWWHKNFIND